jgi:hypothetical protein
MEKNPTKKGPYLLKHDPVKYNPVKYDPDTDAGKTQPRVTYSTIS